MCLSVCALFWSLYGKRNVAFFQTHFLKWLSQEFSVIFMKNTWCSRNPVHTSSYGLLQAGVRQVSFGGMTLGVLHLCHPPLLDNVNIHISAITLITCTRLLTQKQIWLLKTEPLPLKKKKKKSSMEDRKMDAVCMLQSAVFYVCLKRCNIVIITDSQCCHQHCHFSPTHQQTITW